MKSRSAGILLHISSLPSPYGIGDFGSEAKKFVELLKKTRQSVWQILPLTITNAITGNSPYSSLSAFALNSIFVSPELLLRDGFITEKEIKKAEIPSTSHVNYDEVYIAKTQLFDAAYAAFKANAIQKDKFNAFCQTHASWLDDFCLFMVIRKDQNQKSWVDWPEELKLRDKKALDEFRLKYSEEFERVAFQQFILSQQFDELKNFANQNNVQLFGDMPIYVELDSVDVWANPKYFQLNDNFSPTHVAGVPPDYFSETGQRWGNPVYDWEVLKQDRYSWWMSRLEHNFLLFDWVRIDHFRGLVAYWKIPAAEKTAINGEWIAVPLDDFFEVIKTKWPHVPLVAENLGIITDDVQEAMKRHDLPGMKILHFAFNGDMQEHPYLPHNYENNCIVYTGTHDNNTTQGWYKEDAQEDEKEKLSGYIDSQLDEKEIHWTLIEMAYDSKADWAIIPLQDVLGLGGEARMNKPGTSNNNWQWRFEYKDIKEEYCQRVGDLTQRAKRA